LAEWARVRDWRVGQLNKMANVAVFRDNLLTARDVLDFGAEHVVLATGCRWRRDGFGRSHGQPIPGLDRDNVFTPDDLLRGTVPDGPVLLFDDDSFYMGSVLAEVLRVAGREVIFVSPDSSVASWTNNTQEFRQIQQRLRELEIRLLTNTNLVSLDEEGALLACVYSGKQQRVACASLVTITSRLPNEELQLGLEAHEAEWADAGVQSVRAIGDCWAPGLIAHAVYAGHRYARELEAPVAVHSTSEVPFRRRRWQAQ
jgi:dimethylamine/trimethylamine dehydrogenase